MAITDLTPAHLTALREQIKGYATVPGEPRWDEARQAWNLTVDQHPAAVVFPDDADDVVAIVAFAREAGLRVTAQGTGHNAGAHGDLSRSVLIKTSSMNEVAVDPAARTARVGAGALWQDLSPEAARHGLAALAGSSLDVGIVGYTLGGGVGYLGRKHGLASNAVTAIELVTADGRKVRTDADHDPELFWALRGGGGNFGIVTAMEFELFPVESLFGGMLLWPWEESARIYKAWRDWTDTAPDEVTSMARMIKFPPFPDVPEPLRGRKMMVVSAAYLGDVEEAERVLAPLRALEPEIDMLAPMPLEGLMRLHGDPEQPVPGMTAHALIDELPDEAIDALVEQTGPGSDSPLMIVELRHFGGALDRVPEGAGALDRIDAKYMAFTVGIVMDPSLAEPIERAGRDTMALLAPYSHGRAYLNFADRETNTRSAYSVETHSRLKAVKARIDPDGVTHANHVID